MEPRVAVRVPLALEGDDQVERAPRHSAHARGDHVCRTQPLRDAHTALVRVRGEVLDAARGVRGVAQKFVQRLSVRDALVVAVAARMVVGPRDVRRLIVVALAPRLVRVLVFAVEEVRAADPAERAERGA